MWLTLAALSATLLAITPVASRGTAPTYHAEVVNPDLVGGLVVNQDESALFFLWGSDATILRSVDGRRWRHARTPGTADLTAVAANDRGTVMVAVGERGTILRSLDVGLSWERSDNAVDETDLQSVVYAGERAWIAVGTAGRILRSTDDGKSWMAIESGLTSSLRALSVDQGRVWLGGDAGLIGQSRDRGASWRVTTIAMPQPATPIGGFHRFGDLLLATSGMGRFLTSSDDGESWDLMQSRSQAYFMDAARDPDHDVIVMIGHDGDLLRSSDAGRTWTISEIVFDGHKSFLSAIRHDARARALVVSGQSGTVARSSDGGRSWHRGGDRLRGDLRGLLRDPTSGALVAFGAGGVRAFSPDSGVTWQSRHEPLDTQLREVIASPRGDALVATSRLGQILYSRDAGASWSSVAPNYPNANTPPDLRGLVLAPTRDALVAVGPPGAILRSDASGREWRVVEWHDIEAERAYLGVIADGRRKRLVAVEARGAFMTSSDGAHWQRTGLEFPFEAGRFPLWQGSVLEKSGVVLAAGEAGRVVRSADAGSNWQVVDTGHGADFFGSFADEKTSRLFLAGARGTLLRSTDLGRSWVVAETGSDQELRRFMREPRSGALLCVGTRGTILRSEDDGDTWRAVPSGTDAVLRKSLLEPGSGNLLLAGSRGALLRTGDGGRTWQALDTHTARHFNSIASDDRTGDLVLVGERIVRLVRQSPRAKH